MACILCDGKGYRGIDAYGVKVPCDCAACPAGPAVTDEQRRAIQAALAGPGEIAALPPMVLTPALPPCNVVRLRPTDRVVVHYPGMISQSAAALLAESVAAKLGHDPKLVGVLDCGMWLTVLSPDGSDVNVRAGGNG